MKAWTDCVVEVSDGVEIVENKCGGRGGAFAFSNAHLIAQRGVEISRLERHPESYLQGNNAPHMGFSGKKWYVAVHSISVYCLRLRGSHGSKLAHADPGCPAEAVWMGSSLLMRARVPWRAKRRWSTCRAARHLLCAFLSNVDFSLSVFLRNLNSQEHRRIIRRRSLCPVLFNGEDPSNPNKIITSRESGICNRERDSENPRKQQPGVLEHRTLCYFLKRRTHVDPRKVDVRLPGKGNSNSHGARPVHLIITMIKWIRTSRLSVNNSFSLDLAARTVHGWSRKPGIAARVPRLSTRPGCFLYRGFCCAGLPLQKERTTGTIIGVLPFSFALRATTGFRVW